MGCPSGQQVINRRLLAVHCFQGLDAFGESCLKELALACLSTHMLNIILDVFGFKSTILFRASLTILWFIFSPFFPHFK